MKRCYMCGVEHTSEYDIQVCQARGITAMELIDNQMSLDTIVQLDPKYFDKLFLGDNQGYFVRIIKLAAAYILNEMQMKGTRTTSEELQAFAFKQMMNHPEHLEHVPQSVLIGLLPEQKISLPVNIIKKCTAEFFKGIPPNLLAKLPAETFEHLAMVPDSFDPDKAPRDATNRKTL